MLDNALQPYAQGIRNDPNFLAAIGKTPTVKLEKPSVSGGKFWIATAAANSLQIAWGKLGTQGCMKDFQAHQCVNDNIVLEFKKRAFKKLQEGYVITSLSDLNP